MALFDDQWFTGLQTAATSFATAVAGAIGAWLAMRRKVGTDSSELGLLKALQGERDAYKTQWLEAMNSRLQTQETIGGLKALVKELQEREQKLLDAEMHHREKLGGCDERVRLLTEANMEQRLLNGRMYTEMVKLDPVVAAQFLESHLRAPPPPSNGDPRT